jgi:hypothetical protein
VFHAPTIVRAAKRRRGSGRVGRLKIA